MSFKVLSVSDTQLGFIYSPQIVTRFAETDLVIGCGDLPYYYLEYIVSCLNVPLYFVRGNHASPVEYSDSGSRSGPLGAVDLHRRVANHRGLLLAGVEGSLRYSSGPYQYSQAEMWVNVLSLIPSLLANRALHGRYLDIFVSHAPPQGIHDQPDLPHQGISAFLWLLKVFKPAYHFHGHVHVYQPEVARRSHFQDTLVINTYGYLETSLAPGVSGWVPFGFLRRGEKVVRGQKDLNASRRETEEENGLIV